MNKLKNLSPHAKEVATGILSLAQGRGDGPLIKKALLCRTGTFKGMFGKVTVTVELLRGIAALYNATKKNAQNDNDYAPILTDHVREVDRIKGRILPALTVAPWTDPETEDQEFGLYGDLRVDLEDAQAKVKSGLYAHLSISFDEETFELFEVSFVAVEAARGSIILSRAPGGTTMNHSKKFHALAAAVRKSHAARATNLSQLNTARTGATKELGSLKTQLSEVVLSVKTAQLKGTFSAFIRQGKMNPVELQKMDFKKMAGLEPAAIEVLLSSYRAREVSQDVFQHGQSGEAMPKTENMTKEQMQKAIALQKKGGTSLAGSDVVTPKADVVAAGAGDEGKENFSMGQEEWTKALEQIEKLQSAVSSLTEKVNGMNTAAEKLAADDKDAEDAKLAAEEEQAKLAAEEEKAKLQAEEEEKTRLAAEQNQEEEDADKDKK